MATESPIRILEGTDNWPTLKQSTRYGPSSAKTAIEDLGLFLKGQRFQSFEKDIPSRSESAPPSMEGSIAAIETMFSQRVSGLDPGLRHTGITSVNSETNLLFHVNPSSSSHQTSDGDQHLNFDRQLNSSESRSSLHLGGNSGTDGKLSVHSRYSGEPVRLRRSSLPAHEEESEDDRSSEHSASVSVEKASSLGYPWSSLDSTQEDLQQASSSSCDKNKYSKESVVCDATFSDDVSTSVSAAGTNAPTLENVKKISLAVSINASSSNDTGQPSSLDSSNSMVVKHSIHGKGLDVNKLDKQDDLPIAGASDGNETYMENVRSVGISKAPNSESHRVHKKEQLIPQNTVLQLQSAMQESSTSQVQSPYSQIIYPGLGHGYGSLNQFHYGPSNVTASEIQPLLQPSGLTHPLYATSSAFMTAPSPFYPNLQPSGFFTPQYGMSGYAFNSAILPPYLAGYPSQGPTPASFDNASFPSPGVPGGVNLHAYDMHNVQKFYGHVGNPVQPPFADAFHLQYFQQPVRDSYGTYGNFDPQTLRAGASGTQLNTRDSKKGSELIGLPNDNRPQHSSGTSYGNLNVRNKHMSGHYSFGSPTNGVPLVQFTAASIANPVVQAKSPGRSNLYGGRYNMSHSNSLSGNPGRGFGLQSHGWNEMNSYSFLEELKTGKGQRFELSDIAGHIGEFSVDQHGSRFIQQKLENCSDEEKASVFKEVIPHASNLITDVFGNYVIQKLFDYGTPEQRRDLADQLQGQILPLSLQMYGCRVIQKALEVIELEQKTRLVKELDGHVMRCVRDQNGNHVIQKCIESIPANNISFIISSFRGQVPTLSMHPYGCRVIQRVLEHCHDEVLTQFIVDEILDSVCSLAQDQYGNYVTQHVLERGESRERTEIIQKLSGSVVQLSQHKFASNVVEKCLEYSDASARDVLIKEIIGDGEKSDNLLTMMKDQYANYVIQKILQKCTGEQREMLLGLIRNHLVALKKYTYGKHIVARFEQLYGEEIPTSES